ncbi:MAG: leucine--tRNA ligase [Thermoplasmatota archaeon]
MSEPWRARTDALESKWNREWAARRAYVRVPKPGQPKFFATYPYSYMNGFPHVGHAFTMTRTDVMARYQRMLGANVLFPFGFHLTGTPIAAAANRIAEGEPVQRRILIESGIPESEVAKFADPNHWIEFFPKEWRKDVERLGLGLDWSREFFTTDRNPHYDGFVSWQFRQLRTKGLVEKGRHPVIWCPKDKAPVADHDRVEGEGETPQEYTLIKLPLVDPAPGGAPTFLVAATLRPETMYGQTNVWVHPDLDYVEVAVGPERWIVTSDCSTKLPDQFDGVAVSAPGSKGPFRGATLVGRRVRAPASASEIPILPAFFVRGEKGTGIVTSVPSDAPYDYVALRDLSQAAPAFTARLTTAGLSASTIPSLSRAAQEILEALPRAAPLIVVEGAPSLAAKATVDAAAITSQDDRTKLDEATESVYKQGFYSGRMGPLAQAHAGEKVGTAKDAIRAELIARGNAALFYEPTGRVVCRCLTPSVVKIVSDQWFMRYGDASWKKATHEAIDQMTFYPELIRKQFDYVVDWLHDWACAREVGLGTRLPWDRKWVIESLSDSTIYMSYYCIASYLEQGTVTGAAGDRKGVIASDLSDAFFDYVLLGKGTAEGAARGTVTNEIVDRCRAEFTYWYPVDFRNSGKDLIQNHLTFFVFNHVAIWPDDPSKWPRGIAANGWALLNGKKMSKSAGNFLTLRDALDRHGATGLRLALASAGEGVDDANVDEEFADSAGARVAQWLDFATANHETRSERTPVDAWFRSILHRAIATSRQEMGHANFRSALKIVLFDLQREWAWYVKRSDRPQADILREFIEAQTRLLTPFVPHLAEEAHACLGLEGLAIDAPYPTAAPSAIDAAAEAAEAFVRGTLEDAREILRVTGRVPKRILFYTAPAWRIRLGEIADRLRAEGRLAMPTLMAEASKDPMIRPHAKDAPKAAQDILKSATSQRPGTEGATPGPSKRVAELEALGSASDFLSRELGAPVEVFAADAPNVPDPGGKARLAAPGRAAIFVE